MFGIDGDGLLLCGGDERAPGQMVGFPEEAAGGLMNGGDGGLVEEVFLDAGQGEMMFEVLFHMVSIDPFEMASGDDSGGQGL